MEVDNAKAGQRGRFYLTKHIWVPQEPIENLKLKMSDMILRRMPKLPLGGEDAIRAFPVLAELRKSHDKIRADLNYLLSHHEAIPALHEVHPRDLFVPGRAWRTFLLKIWGHEIKENTAAVPAVRERAAIGVPPRNATPPQPQMSQGLISMASHTTSPVNVDRK